MESLKTYLKIAEKACISRRINPSEDLIAFVAEYIMRADIKYKPERGTIYNWRYCYITAGINNFFSKEKKKKKNEINNFDYYFSPEKSTQRLDLFIDKAEGPKEKVIVEDMYNFISNRLTDEQFVLLKSYIDNNFSLQKAGAESNISSANAYKKMKNIRERLKGYKDVLV